MSEAFTPNGGLERLTARDLRVLALWLVVALLGAGVASRYFFRAFPEASVNFQVNRSAALAEARTFASAQGAQLQGDKSAIVFNVDDTPKTYLEREVGLNQANRLMSSQVNVWFWGARFFRPLQKEEYRVRVDPAGRIVGFAHILEDAAPGARLDRAAALARAEAFLTGTLHTSLDGYTFLPEEANSEVRPNRVDWSFTWERTGFKAKDATYRIRVGLAGDAINEYTEFLKVPDAWLRSYAALRSSNNFIETLAILPYALIVGAALSMIIMLGRNGALPWSATLKLTLFIIALYFLMQVNQFPLTLAGYDTNDSYASFWLSQLGSALIESIGVALMVTVAYAPGEPLYRMTYPNRLRLSSAFSFPALRTKEFFTSGVIGLCLAGVHIGYLTLFYIVSGRLGAWAPQDLQYSDTLSTTLPWLFPLTIGIYAAMSEEFLFRMFSVNFLLRTTKSKWLAVILPAFAWSFLHANYPQEPPYIRGIEVGLMGIVAGLVMLRWGILATLTWHYTVDAFLSSLSLMRSHDLYSVLTGSVVGCAAVIPVAIAGVLYVRNGGFASPAALLNGAAPVVYAPPTPHALPAVTAPTYAPLSRSALLVLGLSALAGVALFAWCAKAPEIGDFVRFSVDSQEAQSIAGDVMRQMQIDPDGYHRSAVIQYNFDPLVNEYLRRGIGIDGANRVYRDQMPAALWAVRYFRDSQKEEYLVVLLPNGALHSVHHTLAETTAGPNLPKDQAQALAAQWLQQYKGLDLSQWRLVQAQSEQLPARTDHLFVWEQTQSLIPSPPDGEGAHLRVQLSVQGAEISGYRIFIHVPEQWERQQNQDTLANTARSIGMATFIGGFFVAILAMFFRDLRTTAAAIPWRPLAQTLLVVLVAEALNAIILEPQQLMRYSTDQPLSTFLVTLWISLSLRAILLFSSTVLLFGLAFFFIIRTAGAGSIPGWRRMPAGYYRDAVCLGLGGGLALMGLSFLPAKIAQLWPMLRYDFPARVPDGLDVQWPALHALADAFGLGLPAVGILALALAFGFYSFRKTWQHVVLMVLFAALVAPRWVSKGDFIENAILLFLDFSVIWWGARRLARWNWLGYALIAIPVSLVAAASDLLRQPNSLFRASGWTLLAIIVLLFLWPLWIWRRRNRANPASRGPDTAETLAVREAP